MPISGNVGYTKTFDDWRNYTNQTIDAYNILEKANLQFVTTTPSVLQINGITRGNGTGLVVTDRSNVITLTCNALPTTGGTLTGNFNVNLTPNTVVINTNGLFVNNAIQFLANGHIILI